MSISTYLVKCVKWLTGDSFGVKIVTFSVGQDDDVQTSIARGKLLVQHSDFFAKALNGGWN